MNIALANEFAAFAESNQIDISQVIEASNSQPYSHIHRPGVAVGGHCIPVYPRFYLEGHPEAALVRAARQVNLAVPDRVLQTVATALGGLDKKRVLVLGAAYRGGVKETAYSGVFDLARGVEDLGGAALVTDPLYEDYELEQLGLTAWDGAAVDAAVVQADHEEYSSLTPDDIPGVEVVYDGRGVLDAAKWEASAVKLLVIGQGATRL